MANNEENDDLDLGEEKPRKKRLLIIMVLSLLLLIGGGGAAYFLLFTEGDETMQAAQDTQVDANETEKGPAHYIEMKPVFVINLPGKPSLLQVGVSLRVFSDQMVEFIKHNDPMLRHHLINLLQNKEAATLQGRDAKEALQAEMIKEVNRIVTELSGPGQVDALYFTSFVMQ
jgi:flagellar FliL protein